MVHTIQTPDPSDLTHEAALSGDYIVHDLDSEAFFRHLTFESALKEERADRAITPSGGVLVRFRPRGLGRKCK